MTPAQVNSAFAALAALAEAIRAAGSIPAGHLYAASMAAMDLATFDSFINRLVGAELVRRDASHLLTWIGPTE